MILRHLPEGRFSEVLPAWAGGTAVVIGGGPSLTLEQVERVRTAQQGGRLNVVAVNNSYLLAPWADVLYFADSHWWGWHKDRPEYLSFAGQRCTIQNSGANVTDLTVHMLRNANINNRTPGISLDPQMLMTGRNSSFQSMNLAILAGAKTVLLLGVDGRPAADGRTHWHDGHPRPTPVAAYEDYRRGFSAAEHAITAAGVRVVNCSPGSGVDSFPKVALEDALQEPQQEEAA